ncbi:MAG: S9 family peptidase [Sphingobacteriia bacterium]
MRRTCLLLALLLPLVGLAQPTPKPLSLEDIWLYYRFYPAGTDGFAWMKDDRYYTTYTEAGDLVQQAVEHEDQQQMLVEAKALSLNEKKSLSGTAYTLSTGGGKVLFRTEHKPIYRHSATDQCYVYDRQAQQLQPVFDAKPIMHPTFSPQEDRVAFVYENNLYIQPLGQEAKAITTDGQRNQLIYGASDWVYEEEFTLVRAYEWSPTGRYLAYYRFDETAVKQYSLDRYGSLYPEPYTFKYPKAGELNAAVSLHVYDTQTGKHTDVQSPASPDVYYPRIWWAAGDQLVVARMNRLQNQLDLLLASPENGSTAILLQEKSETYIREISEQTLTFLADGRRYIYLSEKEGFQHAYLREINSSKEIRLTKGDWEITHFYGVDEKAGLIYYQSTEESPLERHIYQADLSGKNKKRLTDEPGTHEADFSPGHSYWVHTYSSVDTPPLIRLRNAKGKVVRVLEDNAALKERIQSYKPVEKRFFTFKNEAGVELYGWEMRPASLEPAQKYPLLLYSYSGPGSQQVSREYNPLDYWWYQYLCTQGYVVVCVDPRGTGARGRDFRAATYRQLGKYETEDLIATADYLATKSYIDPARIGVWGWSYGGYMSSLCITKGAHRFRTAIAVAPVTNWRFYDTIYTERYMATPQENPDGYDDNSPINHADKLKGSYLLIHGMADDNVHLQNAAEMAAALVENNRDFEMFFYPNKNHGIYGGYTRLHLYRQMTEFLDRTLKGAQPGTRH